MTGDGRAPWYLGTRGEWYVVAQVALIGIVFLGPRTLASLPRWPAPLAEVLLWVGAALMLGGGCLLIAGIFRLGCSLTPLPYPRECATLVRTGPYAIVRHPMYAGGILMAFGWAMVVQGWLTLLYAAVLLVFARIKSAREERWLVERFPDYPDYQRRVPRLIPFVRRRGTDGSSA